MFYCGERLSIALYFFGSSAIDRLAFHQRLTRGPGSEISLGHGGSESSIIYTNVQLLLCCGVLSSAELRGAVMRSAIQSYAPLCWCSSVLYRMRMQLHRGGRGDLPPGQCQKAASIAVILWAVSVPIMEAFHGR